MADAAQLNALKDIAKAVREQTRVLEEHKKVMETFNKNFVKIYGPQVTPYGGPVASD